MQKFQLNRRRNSFDIGESGLDDLKALQPGLLTRLLLWLAPQRGIMRLLRELGYPLVEAAEHAHEIFARAQRIDILPSLGAARGFQIVLDGVLCLYFSQDGDHFVYDGFEMGEYEQGDVTVFDEGSLPWNE